MGDSQMDGDRGQEQMARGADQEHNGRPELQEPP